MAREMSRILSRLNDLIALDIDAIEAYMASIKHIEDDDVRHTLAEFREDHQRHVRELSEVVRRFGGEPQTRPDVKGFFLKGFTALTSSMGDAAALRAMRGNERLTTHTYEKALREEWPADVVSLIERNFADEKRHLATIDRFIRERPAKRAQQREARAR